ncbi:uncharacterized protein LOC121429238 [Lytechinus variegatus]|uniref:uncharacterized protein LOC121429238 n=1 Tax=Lytechinus variegatus TaxID=7654 RepID=UPI001BB14D68|nr:uncharacterized protein LOC121429238 [Lytechinus variegatus]
MNYQITIMMTNYLWMILTLCETRLDQSVTNDEIHVNGYRVVRRDRNRNGGGVLTYIHESLNYHVVQELHVNTEGLELLCIQIQFSKQKPFMLIPWYRPPDSNIQIFDAIEEVLQSVETRFIEYILIGDLNCDMLSTNPSSHTKRLLRLATEYNLTQCVKQATRITQVSETLIDHVFSSNCDNVKYCDVIPLSLSDHYMIALSWGRSKPMSPHNHCYVCSRHLKKIDITKFVEDIRKVSWDTVLFETDTELAYINWINKLRAVLDNHAPIKRKRVRRRKSPWMNDQILALIRERNRIKKRQIIQNLKMIGMIIKD